MINHSQYGTISCNRETNCRVIGIIRNQGKPSEILNEIIYITPIDLWGISNYIKKFLTKIVIKGNWKDSIDIRINYELVFSNGLITILHMAFCIVWNCISQLFFKSVQKILLRLPDIRSKSIIQFHHEYQWIKYCTIWKIWNRQPLSNLWNTRADNFSEIIITIYPGKDPVTKVCF